MEYKLHALKSVSKIKQLIYNKTIKSVRNNKNSI